MSVVPLRTRPEMALYVPEKNPLDREHELSARTRATDKMY